MNPNLKLILGSLLLLTLTVFLIIFTNRPSIGQSFMSIVAQSNKFKVNFNIHQNDSKEFSEILESLSLPQSVAKGLEFEIDAASSARLTYLSPIQLKLNISSQSINFSGQTQSPLFLREFEDEDFKIPSSTKLAVFAPDVQGFLKARYSLPPELIDWLAKNFNSNRGQYLLIFGQNSDTAIIFRSKALDFESLKNIQIASLPEPFYKEELQENVNFHLIKLPQDTTGGKDQSLTIFQIGEFVFLTSSRQAAIEMVQFQKKSQGNPINFGSLSADGIRSLSILFRNPDESPLDANFLGLLFATSPSTLENGEAITKSLNHIKELQLVLKGDQFSGLINIK